jgi:hypothetical protein
MRGFHDSPFNVGDRIRSTCGSLYRGQVGKITAIDKHGDPDAWDAGAGMAMAQGTPSPGADARESGAEPDASARAIPAAATSGTVPDSSGRDSRGRERALCPIA